MPLLVLRRSAAIALAVTVAAPSFAQVAPALAPLPRGTAAAAGLGGDRLGRRHARLDRFVAEGEIAGAISLIARQGKIVYTAMVDAAIE